MAKSYNNMTHKSFLSSLLLLFCLFSGTAQAQKKENHNSAITRNLEIFNEIYRILDTYYVDTLSADTVMEWGIKAMLNRVDPYTDYYPQDDDELMEMAQGKYAGIGAVIRYSKTLERVVISEPYVGTPSMKAGLLPGDIIMSIGDTDVKGMLTDKVSNMLRGEAGTTFRLTVQRPGEKKTRTFTITRETISIPHVPYYGIIEKNIGYIMLTGFNDGDALQMRAALMDLKQQGAKGLVLDLRANPGGSLEESVDIANLFLPKGKKIVYTKGKMNSMNHEYFTRTEPVDTIIPLAVLVDGSSASAAEILSGSLQDLDRAVIIGTRTYGKGLVQNIRDLPYGGNMKLTTGRYYIPSGRCVQARDYRHLNEDGSARTLPDSLTSLFHTQNGREVRDGGGINPDIIITPDTLPTMVYDLAPSDVLFDFCTLYVSTHPSFGRPGEASLTDEEYEQFVTYAKEHNFTYNHRSDEVMTLLKEVAEREDYMDLIQAEYDALKAKLTTDLTTDMHRLRKHIEPYLLDELVTRYYHREGAMRQQLVGDKCMEKALEVLSDPEAYNKILKP